MGKMLPGFMLAVCIVYGVYGSQEHCLISNFQTQPNFEGSKFVGKWYEIEWTTHQAEDPYDFWDDFVTTYTLHDNGSFSLFTTYRSNPNKTVCTSQNAVMHRLSNAKYDVVDSSHGQIRHSPQWIISTDYIHYAILYSCKAQNRDGTCKAWIAKTFSRDRTLDDRYMKMAHDTYKDLCLNLKYLYTAKHSNECTRMTDSNMFG